MMRSATAAHRRAVHHHHAAAAIVHHGHHGFAAHLNHLAALRFLAAPGHAHAVFNHFALAHAFGHVDGHHGHAVHHHAAAHHAA